MGIYYKQVCNYFLSILLPDRDGTQIILWTGPLLLWALLVKYMNSPLIKNGERQQESKPSAFTQSALLVCVFNFSLLLQWDQAVMEATRSQVTYREVNSLRTSCFLKKRSMGYNIYVKLKARGPNQARIWIIFGPRDDIKLQLELARRYIILHAPP